MNRQTPSNIERSSGEIVTGVTVLQLDRSALLSLYRKQHVVVESDEHSVLLYINGGDVNGVDISLEVDPDGRCNVTVDAFGRLLRGDTVYWGDMAFSGGPLIVDSTGATLDIDFEGAEQNLVNKNGWS